MPKYLRSSHILLLTSITACISSACVFVLLLTQNSSTYAHALETAYNSDQVIILVNKQRQLYNLPPLAKQKNLTVAATNKVKHMNEKNYFSHVNPSDGKKWSDFIQESGYDYIEAGENLANGYTNVEEMVTAWMNSPTHKANILADGYDETGVAVTKGKLNDHETIFVAQVFGRK